MAQFKKITRFVDLLQKCHSLAICSLNFKLKMIAAPKECSNIACPVFDSAYVVMGVYPSRSDMFAQFCKIIENNILLIVQTAVNGWSYKDIE